jgi:hypothetical protein
VSNIASLELCKELFKVSGWDGTYFLYTKTGRLSTIASMFAYKPLPAYDLGYLLRKLPYKTDLRQLRNAWSASYSNNTYRRYGDGRRDAYAKADTPENAVCQLAIELFKQNILTKEQQS